MNGLGMPETEPPAPELPALVLQVVGSCLPPRAAAQCRLVCRQWRSAFAGSIDRLYLQVHLDAEVTDRHIAAAAAAFPAATRATLLLPNCSYARCNPYDCCGGVSAARTALGRRSNAANEVRRRALLPGAAAAGAAGAGAGAGAALAAAAGQELGEAGEPGRVNGQEAGEADAASTSGQSDSPEEGDGDTGADGEQCATSDAHANAGASAGSASDPALPAAHTAQVLPPAPPLPPPLSPLEVGRLACEAALGSVRRHLPGLVGLRLGHAERPPPRLGPHAALAQSLRHPELAAAAASATASTSTGEPGAAASPSGQQPQQPQQLQCYPGYRLDSAAHATPAALAASHWSYPASLVPAEGAAAWPQPQHTVSQHAAEQAVAAAHRSALDLTPLLLPSAQQDEAAAVVAVAAAAAAAAAGDGAAGGAEGREEEAVAGNAVKGGKAPPPSWATSAPLPRLTSLAELDLRCAAAVGALAPLSSLGSSSGGELTSGYGSSNHAAHGSNNGNLAPDSRQQQQEQQQQQQLPLPALTALTVLQLREGGQLPAIRALGGRLRALDLWCNEGSSLADLAYWTSAAPQRIRRGLPLLASGLTRLTRLVLRELAAQVEPPAALTCLCSLPLLSSLTAEVLYVDPWRQLAELAEQLAGDEEEAAEEEGESEGEEEEEQSEEGSESGSESEEESDGGEEDEESEELGSSEEGLVAPAAAARAREGSAARLPPAARAREMEFSFSRSPQLGLSGVSAGAGGGVNGADFAAAVAATQAAATPSPADAAAAAAAGSAASPSVATRSAGPAPAVAPASAATAAIAAAAAAAELAALAVALGPRRAEHIRAVLERGSGALQEMAPMDLFSCFAGGSSNGSSNGSSSAAAGAAGGSGSSRVGLTELDVTFVGCGLLPGCWAGVEALGGSLRRLALRVGRSAEEERLVVRLLQRLAPAASSSSTVSSGWLPGAFRVTSLSALPHLNHLELDTPLCPRLAARLQRLAPPPPPPAAQPQPPVQPPPEPTRELQQLALRPRLESLQLYGVHDVEVEASPQPQPLQTPEGKSASHDARTELTTPLPLAPAASATAMMRKLHLDGDLSAVAAALAGGALVGVTGHEGCSSPAGLLLPRLAELRLAHRPAGRPATAAAWLLLPWRALPPSLEQLHLEGLDMRLQPLTASSYISSSSSGGNRGKESGQQLQLLLPRLQRLQLRHCAAELGPLRGCPLEELAVAAAWLLLPGSDGAKDNGAAAVAAVAVAPAVAAAPWDVAAQLAAVRSQPWTPRLRSLSLQLCATPRGATRLRPSRCDTQACATAAPASAGAGAAAVAAAATPGATAAMPGLERLSVTWELAALVDPDALPYGTSESRWAAPPADPDVYGSTSAAPSVGLTPRAARALLEGLLPPGAVSAVGGGGGGGAACASASGSPGGAEGSGSGRSTAPAGAAPVLRSLELYVGDVGGGADDGGGGGGSEGGLSVEELLWLARLRSLRRLRLVLCVSESGGDPGAATGTIRSFHTHDATAATAAGAAGGPDVAAPPPACAAAGVRAAAPAVAGPTSAWLHAELGELLLAALPYCQTQVVQVRVP